MLLRQGRAFLETEGSISHSNPAGPRCARPGLLSAASHRHNDVVLAAPDEGEVRQPRRLHRTCARRSSGGPWHRIGAPAAERVDDRIVEFSARPVTCSLDFTGRNGVAHPRQHRARVFDSFSHGQSAVMYAAPWLRAALPSETRVRRLGFSKNMSSVRRLSASQ